VWVIPGSPTGLDIAGGYIISQDSPGMPGTAETGDQFGRSIDVSYYGLLVGAPDEDHHAVNSGSVYVITEDSATVVHQDTPGVPGTQEAHDRFGKVVRAGPTGMIVGVPHEAVGAAKGAGMVHLFGLGGDGSVKPGRTYTQNDSDVAGTSESGDHFGDAIAAGGFISGAEGSGAFAVGAPNEGLGSEGYQHGMVHVFVVPDFADAGREAYTVHQNTYGVAGEAESGDHFGAGLVIGMTPPDPEYDGDRHPMVTVLSRGEGSDIEQGTSPAIQVFEGLRDVGHDDRWIKAGEYGLPADAELSPSYVEERGDRLLLAEADGALVYGVPTGNIAFGETEPVVRYGP
ncbi:MAG: FG-GAP repeat protein, partial [Micromonosporaceae bacterium]